jgi:hypothetical protein
MVNSLHQLHYHLIYSQNYCALLGGDGHFVPDIWSSLTSRRGFPFPLLGAMAWAPAWKAAVSSGCVFLLKIASNIWRSTVENSRVFSRHS